MYDKKKFIKDYLKESKIRLELAEYSIDKKRYNIAVRECQVATELAIKSLLFRLGRIIPKTHNLREELKEIKDLLSSNFQDNFDFILRLSSKLRIERERSLYGDVELNITPGESYSESDANRYLEDTKKFMDICEDELKDFLN